MVAEPNKVAVQVEAFATTVEGRHLQQSYNVYFEFEGGKILRVREYNDTALTSSTRYARGNADQEIV